APGGDGSYLSSCAADRDNPLDTRRRRRTVARRDPSTPETDGERATPGRDVDVGKPLASKGSLPVRKEGFGRISSCAPAIRLEPFTRRRLAPDTLRGSPWHGTGDLMVRARWLLPAITWFAAAATLGGCADSP